MLEFFHAACQEILASDEFDVFERSKDIRSIVIDDRFKVDVID